MTSDCLPHQVRAVPSARRSGAKASGRAQPAASAAASPTKLDPMRPIDLEQLRLQEQTSAVYSYYDVPFVSVRDGLGAAFLSGTLDPLDWLAWGDFGFHPTPSMQAYAAGALLEAIRRAAVLIQHEGDVDGAPAGAALGGLPAPLHPGLQLRHPLACFVWGVNYRLNWREGNGYRLLARAHALAHPLEHPADAAAVRTG
jgi:hypothetical protein